MEDECVVFQTKSFKLRKKILHINGRFNVIQTEMQLDAKTPGGSIEKNILLNCPRTLWEKPWIGGLF